MKSLDGQVAIITGAGAGIGAGIADVLSSEGASVAVIDIDLDAANRTVAALQAQGRTAMGLAADVSNVDSLVSAVAEVLAAWGRVDIFAANAGIYPQIPLSELTQSDWDRTIDINLRGAWASISAVMGPMRQAGYGRIVLTSSITGPVTGQAGYSHYGASKAGMLGLMRSAAIELADAGITVNAVLPGNIATPGFADLGPDHERRMLAAIPLGTFGTAQDVGWCVRFLASAEARYITGQTLIVDGGQVLPESAPSQDDSLGATS